MINIFIVIINMTNVAIMLTLASLSLSLSQCTSQLRKRGTTADSSWKGQQQRDTSADRGSANAIEETQYASSFLQNTL